MKKLVLASILVASSLFAADVATQAKELSDIAFKNRIEAGKLEKKADELRQSFRDEMRAKLNALSDEDKAKFMQEFRKNMDEKIDKLSVKEAREMGFGRHFERGGHHGFDRGGYKNFGHKGGCGMHDGIQGHMYGQCSGGMMPCDAAGQPMPKK